MVKRKGSIIESAPCTVVTSSSPPSAYKGVELSKRATDEAEPTALSDLMKRLEINTDERRSVRSSRKLSVTSVGDEMDRLVASYSTSLTDSVQMVEATVAVVQLLESEFQGHLESRCNGAVASLQQQINTEDKLYRSENDDIIRQEDSINDLEQRLNALRKVKGNLCEEKRQCELAIENYKEETKREIEQIDEIEAEHISQLPRMKRTISLFALISGVKWNYDTENLLEGEVIIPTTKEVRRFSMDPDGLSDFQIANKLWSIIEGQPDER